MSTPKFSDMLREKTNRGGGPGGGAPLKFAQRQPSSTGEMLRGPLGILLFGVVFIGGGIIYFANKVAVPKTEKGIINDIEDATKGGPPAPPTEHFSSPKSYAGKGGLQIVGKDGRPLSPEQASKVMDGMQQGAGADLPIRASVPHDDAPFEAPLPEFERLDALDPASEEFKNAFANVLDADLKTAEGLSDASNYRGAAKAIFLFTRHLRTQEAGLEAPKADVTPDFKNDGYEAFRGKVLSFNGTLARKHERKNWAKLPGNNAGLGDTWTLICRDANGKLFAALVPQDAQGLKEGDHVTWTGLFVQRWSFLKPDNSWGTMPLFVAGKIEKIEKPAPPQPAPKGEAGDGEAPAPAPGPVAEGEGEAKTEAAVNEGGEAEKTAASDNPPPFKQSPGNPKPAAAAPRGPTSFYGEAAKTRAFKAPLPEFEKLETLDANSEAFKDAYELILDEDLASREGLLYASEYTQAYQAVFLFYRYLRTHADHPEVIEAYAKQRREANLEKLGETGADAKYHNVLFRDEYQTYRGQPYFFHGNLIRKYQIRDWSTEDGNNSGIRDTWLLICRDPKWKLYAVLVPEDMHEFLSKDDSNSPDLIEWTGLFLQRWTYIRRDNFHDAMPLYVALDAKKVDLPDSGANTIIITVLLVFGLGLAAILYYLRTDERRSREKLSELRANRTPRTPRAPKPAAEATAQASAQSAEGGGPADAPPPSPDAPPGDSDPAGATS
ncbi:MAG: hypothetical protein L6R28_09040 [Planctomycetes bacterium]|nr:hypothetical protein [Planctomycetota bacterium]